MRPTFESKTETKTTTPFVLPTETKNHGIPVKPVTLRIITLWSDKRGHFGPYGTIWGHIGQYGAIQGHMGYKGGHTGP